MWVMLNDAFLSIVSKECARNEVMVRARRAGDIERVFGKRVKVVTEKGTDYNFRAVVKRDQLNAALVKQVKRINYPNFKNSVIDDDLHDAYMKVWTAMLDLQRPRGRSADMMFTDEVKR